MDSTKYEEEVDKVDEMEDDVNLKRKNTSTKVTPIKSVRKQSGNKKKIQNVDESNIAELKNWGRSKGEVEGEGGSLFKKIENQEKREKKPVALEEGTRTSKDQDLYQQYGKRRKGMIKKSTILL